MSKGSHMKLLQQFSLLLCAYAHCMDIDASQEPSYARPYIYDSTPIKMPQIYQQESDKDALPHAQDQYSDTMHSNTPAFKLDAHNSAEGSSQPEQVKEELAAQKIQTFIRNHQKNRKSFCEKDSQKEPSSNALSGSHHQEFDNFNTIETAAAIRIQALARGRHVRNSLGSAEVLDQTFTTCSQAEEMQKSDCDALSQVQDQDSVSKNSLDDLDDFSGHLLYQYIGPQKLFMLEVQTSAGTQMASFNAEEVLENYKNLKDTIGITAAAFVESLREAGRLKLEASIIDQNSPPLHTANQVKSADAEQELKPEEQKQEDQIRAVVHEEDTKQFENLDENRTSFQSFIEWFITKNNSQDSFLKSWKISVGKEELRDDALSAARLEEIRACNTAMYTCFQNALVAVYMHLTYPFTAAQQNAAQMAQSTKKIITALRKKLETRHKLD